MTTPTDTTPQKNISDFTDFEMLNLKYLKKMYSDVSPKELRALNREIIFAPKNFKTTINNIETPIQKVRQNLAEYIERDAASKNFIPYSLDTEIADLIESSNCETSSMNEYYRWVGSTMDILRHVNDGDITQEDLNERKNFISTSYDRETEILLCLALYESAGIDVNKEKIELLRFKLARLREMRSIIKNTPDLIHKKDEYTLQMIKNNYTYCKELLSKKSDITPNINVKLNIDINHSNDSDVQENYSHLEHLREVVLYMMRVLEQSQFQNEQSKQEEKYLHITNREENASSREQERC